MYENNYTNEVDIWQLGCIMFEMLTSKKLFDGVNVNEIRRKILQFSSVRETFKLFQSQLKYGDKEMKLVEDICS